MHLLKVIVHTFLLQAIEYVSEGGPILGLAVRSVLSFRGDLDDEGGVN